jgi:phosphoribosyl 1,2-cyclic phosphodiesterase
LIEIKPLASSSKGNAYWVTDGQTPLLLECGIPFNDIRKKLNFQTSDITGCLVTHSHNDHSHSVKDVAKAGIDCYMSQPTAEAIGAEGHRIKTVEAKKPFQIRTWTILPFDTVHDAPGSLGYLLANQVGERLLFLTDTAYCKYRFNDLTHLVIECNHSREIVNKRVHNGEVPMPMKIRLITSHFSLEQVKEFLKANDLSKVQQIVLIHLSQENSDESLFKKEIQALTGRLVTVAPA